MIVRAKTPSLLPLLALTAAVAMAATLYTQGARAQVSTSASLRINFGTAPHWTSISGTRVEEVPMAERRDYDVFRYNGSYYAYNNNRWYMSPRESGDFAYIDDRSVPTELTMVPRDHWRNYPSSWQQRHDQQMSGTSGNLQITFGNRPRWTGISGTRVEELPVSDRRDYDVFRYNGSYYAYNNNRWYTSTRESGDFSYIDDNSVPNELSLVPRDHWRNYPSSWQQRQNQRDNDASASLQVTFGNRPRWTGVRGTRISVIRNSDRPAYDMFRYGNRYYVYNNNRWYMSTRYNGRFMAINDRAVPYELSRVPRESWRNYPTAWLDQNGNPRNGRNDRRR